VIFGINATKSAIVIAETRGAGGNFVITAIRSIPFQIRFGEDLAELLRSLRACLKSHLFSAETFEHKANHSQIDHGFAGLGLSFVVAIESAVASEPTEGAFDHPTAGQHFEGMKVGALDDLDGAAPPSPRPSACEYRAVASV
jgi:hypothetical protein